MSWLRAGFGLVAAGLQLFAYQSQPASDAAPQGSIEGQVLNLETDSPIRKAIVELAGQAAQSDAHAVQTEIETDAEGRFRFAGLKAGRYHLEASRDGYLKSPAHARRLAETDIPLGIEESRKDIVLKLEPMSVISGRVVDEDGDPVMDLDVEALSLQYRDGKRQWVESGQTKTTDLGEYRIAMLAPGQYLLKTASRHPLPGARARDLDQPFPDMPDTIYPATYYPGVVDESRATPVEATMGQETRGIVISTARAKAFRVRGTVAGAAGIGRIAVVARRGDAKGDYEGWFQLASPESRFELRGLLPGSYALIVMPQDDPVPDATASQTIQITDHHVEGVVLTMAFAGDVKGSVRLEGPTVPDISGLKLEVHGSDQTFSTQAAVGKDLNFVLKDVLPIPASIQVVDMPECCFVKSIRYDDQDVTESGVVLRPGRTVDVLLSPTAGRVEGVVSDKDGKPLAGAIVALIPNGQNATTKGAESDRDGRFRFAGLRPGDYKLLAWEEVEPGAFEDTEFVKRFEAQTQTVSVDAGGHRNVQLKAIEGR